MYTVVIAVNHCCPVVIIYISLLHVFESAKEKNKDWPWGPCPSQVFLCKNISFTEFWSRVGNSLFGFSCESLFLFWERKSDSLASLFFKIWSQSTVPFLHPQVPDRCWFSQAWAGLVRRSDQKHCTKTTVQGCSLELTQPCPKYIVTKSRRFPCYSTECCREQVL